MMKCAVLLASVLLMGCPKKTEEPVHIWNPEPVEFDIQEDEDLDDLPEAGDSGLKKDEHNENQ